MGIFEIISAIALILACVVITVVVLMQDSKSNMSQAISGVSADNFFQKNAGRTKEAKLNKTCTVAAVVFFVLALVVNLINVHLGGSAAEDEGSAGTTSSVTDTVATGEADADIVVDVPTAPTAEAPAASTAEAPTAPTAEAPAAPTTEAAAE